MNTISGLIALSLPAALAGASAFTSGNHSGTYGYGNVYGSGYASTTALATSISLFAGKAAVLIIKFKVGRIPVETHTFSNGPSGVGVANGCPLSESGHEWEAVISRFVLSGS